MKLIINPGQKIGRLTAIKSSHVKNSVKYWLFKCDCGKETITQLTMVFSGRTRSCGCLRKESARKIGMCK